MKPYLLTLNGIGRITQNWIELGQSLNRDHMWKWLGRFGSGRVIWIELDRLDLEPAWSWTSIEPAGSWIFNWIISSISNWSWPVWTSWSRICWTALEKPSLMALAPLRVVGPRLTKGTSIWMAASPVPKPISCQALQFSPLRLFHFVFSHLWFLELPETTHDHQE